MVCGILKDTKDGEHRVILTPLEVKTITGAGHKVYVQKDCGLMAGFSDEKYKDAGAEILKDTPEIYRKCDLVAKVKEFTELDFPHIRENQILLGCMHPAANPDEVQALLKSKCIAFTAEDSHRYGSPNCEAAGKQGALFGLQSMLTTNGGKGKYVGGFAGVPGMNVIILGAGIVGQGALSVLYALGAHCTVMDINIGVLRAVSDKYNGRIDTALCSREQIKELLPQTDMVINCVKWDKNRRDFLVDREMLRLMEEGSVLVDISNDNPGAIESSRRTSHRNPTYKENGVVHFCVDNIPSAVAQSASRAYASSMLPLILSILDKGAEKTCIEDEYYRRSLVAYKGCLTHGETSAVQKIPRMLPEDAFPPEYRTAFALSELKEKV